MGPKNTYQIYGVYDLIAKVEGESAEGVRGVLQEKIRRLNYVRITLTLMVV